MAQSCDSTGFGFRVVPYRHSSYICRCLAKWKALNLQLDEPLEEWYDDGPPAHRQQRSSCRRMEETIENPAPVINRSRRPGTRSRRDECYPPPTLSRDPVIGKCSGYSKFDARSRNQRRCSRSPTAPCSIQYPTSSHGATASCFASVIVKFDRDRLKAVSMAILSTRSENGILSVASDGLGIFPHVRTGCSS